MDAKGIRDMEFPDDACRAHRALLDSLEYDAAASLVGNRLAQVLSPTSLPPPPTVPVAFGPEAAQSAVFRDFEGLMQPPARNRARQRVRAVRLIGHQS